MRSQKYIIGKHVKVQTTKSAQDREIDRMMIVESVFPFCTFIALFLLTFSVFSTAVFSQNIAIIDPEPSQISGQIVSLVESGFSPEFDIVERSMSEMIFTEREFERPFNLSIEDSRNYGASVGSNYFLLVKTDTLRRTSFEREKYFESYIAYFLVSSRTGKLLFWKLSKYEEDSPEISEQKLAASIENSIRELSETIHSSENEDTLYRAETDDLVFETAFAESKDFRPPMPYLRIKPEYTKTAAIYDVLATVDVAVEIDDTGNVKNIEILRWAGFGLDESVIETIRGLKWRPGDLKGEPLAMRVLLRYNFKNTDSESETDSN